MRPRRNVAVYTAGSRRVNPLVRGAGGARRLAPGHLPALRPAPAESFRLRPGRRRAGNRLPRPKRSLSGFARGGSVAAAIEQVLPREASVSARPMPFATAATLERSRAKGFQRMPSTKGYNDPSTGHLSVRFRVIVACSAARPRR